MNPDLMPLIRQCLPAVIARDIVNVQTITAPTQQLFNIKISLPTYTVVGKWKHKNGFMYYNVQLSKEVRQWLSETYADDKTAWWAHNKYCKVREDVLPLLHLKFG